MSDNQKLASRESHWNELDVMEKIERMRRVIKDQANLIDRMTKYLNLLVGHGHLDGKLVSRIQDPNSESVGGFYHRKRSDEWF